MTEQPESYTNKSGNKIWYLPSRGKDYIHRLDGPAIKWVDGSTYWYVNNKQHRLDGPAVINLDVKGNICQETWVINDIWLNEDVVDWIEENGMTAPYSEEDQMAIMLRWG